MHTLMRHFIWVFTVCLSTGLWVSSIPRFIYASARNLGTCFYMYHIFGMSSIPVRSHTFVEMDHEIISTVILLPSAESFKKGCCQLQAKVCARCTG